MFPRIRLVAWHVFKESVRDRVLYGIVAFALMLVGASLLIGQITAGQDLKIIKDLGLATIEVAGLLMSVFIGIGLVSREIDRRSIHSLLAKPLPRWEFIVGKYLGLLLTVCVNVGLMTVAFYVMLAVMGWMSPENVRKSWEAPAADPALLLAIALILGELALLTAIALCFSTFSSSALLSLVFTIGVWVAGLLSEELRHFGDLVESPLVPLVSAIGWVVPAFSVFDIKTDIVHGHLIPATLVLWRLLYAGVYSVVVVGVGVALFSRRGIPMRVAAAGLLAAGFALAGVVLHAGDARDPSRGLTRVLYLTGGRTAGRVMLSFDALAADVYWMRAIQHYGRDRKSVRTTDRFDLLYPLLDLATTLDPDLNIAYRFGAVFLAQPAPNGPNRVDLAVTLLKKGLAHNPTQWKYALDIGFLYYWYGGGGSSARADFTEAAHWFEVAVAMPGAPQWIHPLAALTRAQGGDRAGARQMLAELAQSDEPWIRSTATRGLAQVQAMDDIDLLQTSVDRYMATTHVQPTSWGDLIRAGLIRGTPLDPAHVPYEYNTAINRVVLSPQSPLWPPPRTLERR